MATFAWRLRGLHVAHRTRIWRVTYALDSRRCARVRHIHESDANVARTCRTTRDVTFRPLYV
jgi:hypothetical protein